MYKEGFLNIREGIHGNKTITATTSLIFYIEIPNIRSVHMFVRMFQLVK